jgi:hypothetical protein
MWVDKYGTGSGSDRIQLEACTCNAQCVLAFVEYEWKLVLNGTSGRYRSRF